MMMTRCFNEKFKIERDYVITLGSTFKNRLNMKELKMLKRAIFTFIESINTVYSINLN